MNKNGSLYFLGVGIIIVGIAEFIMILFALLMDDSRSIYAFSGAAILCIFCGLTLVLATKGKHEALGRIDSILLLVYFWVIIPVFAAIPFFTYFGTFTDAYIEAVSALTTTGASVIEQGQYIPRSLFLWRNLLAWSGGLLTITMVILILAPMGVGGLQDKSSKFLGARFRKSGNFAPIITMVGGTYGLITIILVVALMFGGARPFDALNIILSTISTAGYNNYSVGFGYYDSAYTASILMLSMFIGAALIIIFFQ